MHDEHASACWSSSLTSPPPYVGAEGFDLKGTQTLFSVTIDLHTRKGKHPHEKELDFSSTESLISRSS
jgi:hypothetical protein